MPKERPLIERPQEQFQMNVINLLDDFVNIALKHRTFVVNLLDDPNGCVLPPNGPLSAPILLGGISIKWKRSNIFSPIIDATIQNNKEIVQAMD
jgi:hypothetical protein